MISHKIQSRLMTIPQTDNPGPWFLHCHIDWHLEAGFAIVFAEDLGDTISANAVNGMIWFCTPVSVTDHLPA